MLTQINESVQDPPQLIRVGDRVMVTKPEFVVRVGYPLSFEKAKQWVIENQGKDIERLFLFGAKEEAIQFGNHRIEPNMGRISTRAGKRIVSTLAKAYQDCKGFGGRERRIHTVRHSEWLGKIYTVKNRKVVKTGDYYPPYGYDGDWEPGGLNKEKTHVLLLLEWRMHTHDTPFFETGLWIERCNVKKLEDNDE